MPYKDKSEQKARRRRYYLAHREEEIMRASAWNKAHPRRAEAQRSARARKQKHDHDLYRPIPVIRMTDEQQTEWEREMGRKK